VNLSAQFLKYVVVAAVSAMSDWLVFVATIAIFSQPIFAYGTARIAGAVVSFVVNKSWSFKSLDFRRAPLEAGRFLLLFAVSYTLAVSLFYALSLSGFGPYWSKLIADTICFFGNFVGMRYWVYRHVSGIKAADENSQPDRHLAERWR
jgi:putative flippase GtrA